MESVVTTWLTTCSKEEFHVLFFFFFDSWIWTTVRMTCATGLQVLTEKLWEKRSLSNRNKKRGFQFSWECGGNSLCPFSLFQSWLQTSHDMGTALPPLWRRHLSPQEKTEFQAKRTGKGASVVQRVCVIPLLFSLVPLSSSFWGQYHMCGIVQKHKRLAPHLSGQRN